MLFDGFSFAQMFSSRPMKRKVAQDWRNSSFLETPRSNLHTILEGMMALKWSASLLRRHMDRTVFRKTQTTRHITQWQHGLAINTNADAHYTTARGHLIARLFRVKTTSRLWHVCHILANVPNDTRLAYDGAWMTKKGSFTKIWSQYFWLFFRSTAERVLNKLWTTGWAVF